MYAEEYYSQEPEVHFLHKLPRFGHSSEFSKLASSDQKEQADYVVGILAVSFFIISLLIFLFAAVMTCKCMGKRRVGLCAGRARVVSDDKGQFRPPNYLWTLRCSFVVLGCFMILLAMMLVGPGLSSVENTSVSIRKLNRDVKDLITQGLLIMDSVKRVRWNMDSLDVQATLQVDKACPNLDNNTFISDKKMRSSIRGLKRDFDDLKDYLQESDFEGIRQHIDHILDGTEYIDSAVSVVERNDWTVRMFALVLNVLVFFMIFAACAALSGRCHYLPALRWMAELLILPLFVILVVASWLATSVLAIGSISNADFCSGNSQQSGPSGTVMGVFEQRGITDDDIIFATFSYYQSGCETDDPIYHLYQYEDDIQGGIGSANEFLMQADKIGIEEINEQCGANVKSIIEGVGLIKDNLGILLNALRSTYELASCSKMSPIYRHAFEGTVCTESSGSLTLMFSIMFGINIVGMLMIMLRASMYPYKKAFASSSLDDEEDEWEEYQAYLRYMASFVTLWGGGADEDGVASKTGTNETAASTESYVNTRPNTPTSIISDEESPQSPRTMTHNSPSRGQTDEFNENEKLNPLYPCSPLSRAQTDRSYENEELKPLSPESEFSTDSIAQTPDQSRIRTPPQTKRQPKFGSADTKFISAGYFVGKVGDAGSSGSGSPRRRTQQQHRGGNTYHDSPMESYFPSSTLLLKSSTNISEINIDNDDELTPLSPNTPSIQSSGRGSRRKKAYTQSDSLSAGLPETPLITSPSNGRQNGANYFRNIISPLRSMSRQQEGGSVKRE